MKKLLNKVVLVTGSSIGIGKAIAEAFANEGAEVIVVSHNSTEEGLATADNIGRRRKSAEKDGVRPRA